MATIALVDKDIELGQRLLDRLAEDDFEVSAACWVNPQQKSNWWLYIVTPLANRLAGQQVTRRVNEAIRTLPDPRMFEISFKVVADDSPFGKEVLDLLAKFPLGIPSWAKSTMLGDVPVEDFYVYDLLKTRFTIFGMAFDGEPSRVLHLSFDPHNPNSSMTIDGKTYPAKTGIDFHILAPASAKLVRDEFHHLKLHLDLQGRELSLRPEHAYSYAKLGLNGFRLLKDPD